MSQPLGIISKLDRPPLRQRSDTVSQVRHPDLGGIFNQSDALLRNDNRAVGLTLDDRSVAALPSPWV